MKLVLLFGPPASGKHTVGIELQKLTGFRFFHNHLVVDAVLSLFEFGSPAFCRMREQLWRDLLFEAAKQDHFEGVIFTFNPESTVSKNFVSLLISDLEKKGMDTLLIKLDCPEDVIKNRLDQPSRHKFKKLTSLELYSQLKSQGAFDDSWMPIPDLLLDTSKQTAVESAKLVAKYISQNS